MEFRKIRNSIEITLSNGKQFMITEEKFGMLEITANDSISIFPRYSNQVEIDSSEVVEEESD